MVVWRSDSALVSINKVNLRRARLVLGWVTVQLPVRDIDLRMVASLAIASWVGAISTSQRPVTPYGFDALRLGSKGRYGLWLNGW